MVIRWPDMASESDPAPEHIYIVTSSKIQSYLDYQAYLNCSIKVLCSAQTLVAEKIDSAICPASLADLDALPP